MPLAAFNFTDRMRGVAADMCARLSELAHIDLTCVVVATCQTRKPVTHGIFASLTPLRFAGGASTTIRRGRPHGIQRVLGEGGREMLYILSFYLPRFQDLPLREKLITVLHELWHISPNCDGDIRRHDGRYHAHSHSQAEYDREMGVLADRWVALGPPPELWDFLRDDFAQLAARHSRIVGLRIRRPRIVPLPAASA